MTDDEYFVDVEAEVLPRLRELLDRLIAPGQKAEHVSTSETHEIHALSLVVVEAFREAKARLERFDYVIEREEERRLKRGKYWLTKEGREELREAFDDDNGSCAVRPLLNALEAAEKRIRQLDDFLVGHDSVDETK